MKGKINIPFLILGFFIIIFAVSLYYKLENRSVEKNLLENAKLRVEVLNGCGVDNLALMASDELRKMGFDVVETGDASGYNFEETVVIDRIDGDLANARRLGKAIGCSKLGKDIDSSLYIDVTILLGKDFDRYFPEIQRRPKWMH